MGNTFANFTGGHTSTGHDQNEGQGESFFGRNSSMQKKSEHHPLSNAAQESLNNLNRILDNQSLTHYQPGSGPIFNIAKHNATYQGKFEKGNPNGRGVAHFHDGSYYSGDFVHGDANGKGLFIYPNGSVYEGNFVNSKFGGQGTLVYIDRRMTYEGNFVDGLPEGSGRQTYSDGGFYEGQFEKGQKHGYGIYQWANGPRYEGYFQHGLMHGKGVLKNRNEIVYQGEFVRGQKSGYGIFKTAEGTYEGNFDNDLLNGEGAFVWNDGKVYEGTFKNSMMDGRGRMLYTTNQIAEGEWEKNHNKSLTNVRNDPGIKSRLNEIVQRHESALRPGFVSKLSDFRESEQRDVQASGINTSNINRSAQVESPVAYEQPRPAEYV